MDDVIQVQDQFYILATAPRAGDRTAVLQHGDTFGVFDLFGDVGMFGASEQGLYHEGTRYLSRFAMRLNGRRPLMLSARVKEDNELFGADLTNPDMPLDGQDVIPRDIVHLFRSRFLWNGAWHERIRVANYGRAALRLSLTFDIAADFADIFEVRGTRRERRGATLDAVVGASTLKLGYRGLDREERWTVFEWSEPPAAMSATVARFDLDAAQQSPLCLSLSIRCERTSRPVAPRAYDVAMDDAAAALGT